MPERKEAPLFTLADLDRVLERVEKLGVTWRGSRFEAYRNELAAHRAPTPEFVKAFHEDATKQRLTFEAGMQFTQLIMAERAWDALEAHLVKKTLAAVFEGPTIDPPSDDRPRNTLLELLAASMLVGHFKTRLTAKAEDVRLDHPEIGRGAVESKRPLHMEKLLSNLNEIGRQLRSREAGGSQYGVAVIGGDRIAQTASNAFESETAEEAYGAVRDMATTLAHQVEHVSRDIACDVVPAASRAIVIVTGAVLVRKPRAILQPVVSAIGFPLGDPGHRSEVHRTFETSRGPLLEDMLVDHRVGQSR
jgi:hypothetical protein